VPKIVVGVGRGNVYTDSRVDVLPLSPEAAHTLIGTGFLFSKFDKEWYWPWIGMSKTSTQNSGM
jgi:hypothetical protein